MIQKYIEPPRQTGHTRGVAVSDVTKYIYSITYSPLHFRGKYDFLLHYSYSENSTYLLHCWLQVTHF